MIPCAMVACLSMASAQVTPPSAPPEPLEKKVEESPAPAAPPAQPAPTAQAPIEQPRTVVVNAVAYRGGSPVTGDCTPVRVTAGGGDGSKVRVGFFETEVGGTGDQWRSAGWTAAATATMITDFDPRAMHVSFEYEGIVDGPSAGALMTVGVLAAVRGDTPRPDAAMTGTINPDGSIGPVGGIPHKIEGAAAKGMKLMLIPEGSRYELNQNTGERVDLFEYGRKLGVEVRPVFDVYAAYEDLTGVELPRPPAARLPHIPLEFQKEVEAKSNHWHKMYTTALDSYSKMPGKAKLTQEAVDLYKRGLEIIQHAEQMQEEGETAAVYWDHVRAAMHGYMALELGRCRQTYATTGYPGTVRRLRDNGWLETEVRMTATRMRNETPKSLDQVSMYFHACDAFLEALSLQHIARDTLANLPGQESEAATELVVGAATHQIIAWLNLRLARDYLDLGATYGGAPIPAQAPWRDIGDYLRRASRANLAAFDALIVNSQAKSQAMTADQYREGLMQKDLGYAMLHIASESVFPQLTQYLGEGEASGYCWLAANLYVHTRAAGLLAKYYSLGLSYDDEGNLSGLTKERTLNDWLAFAEDQSRRNIVRLKSCGIDATPCVQVHQIARIKSHRDLSEKLEALYEFWSADLHAQVLRRIANQSAQTP
ncbi:MAG: hypothetical protein IT427_12480 [Pirellulales bacterium]|nr:hypothetical protein [Pirellulales bacterium]